jgi:hypothetical protein
MTAGSVMKETIFISAPQRMPVSGSHSNTLRIRRAQLDRLKGFGSAPCAATGFPAVLSPVASR